MTLIAWRSIVCHKVRSALLALCVVIGVAFVAGTYVLTDTIKNVFTDVFDQAYKGTAVNVRSQSDLGSMSPRSPVPEALVTAVAQVPGVRLTEGVVFTIGGRIFDAANKPVGNEFAPTFLASWPLQPDLNSFTIASGATPQAPDEVVIDQQAVTQAKFSIGDTVRVQTLTGINDYRLVGVAKYGEASNMGGASIVLFDLVTAQAVANRVDQFDSIGIAAVDGVDSGVLQDQVQAVVGPQYEAITGADLSAESSKTINDAFSFFGTFLLAFAAISLLVGASIVYNTFAIVVAQRTKEMALLRALGADGRQVVGSIVIESIIIGLIASAVGLVAGVGLAIGLKGLLNVLGFAVPGGSLVVLPRTIVVSVLGGMLVTVVSAIAPAIRAARVPPLAAVRSVTTAQTGNRRWLLVVGAVLGTVGAIAAGVGAESGKVAWLGLGAVGVLAGVSMVAPSVVPPFVRVLATPIRRWRGTSGQLAEENATRSARRTANTAASLMIGTAVIAAALLLASSINKSTNDTLDQGLRSELIVSAGGIAGLGPQATETLRSTPGVAGVAPYRYGSFKIGDSTKQIVAMDGTALDVASSTLALDLDATAGSLRSLDEGGIAVSDSVAKAGGWNVGDTIPAVFAAGATPLRIQAIFHTTAFGSYLISIHTHQLLYPDSTDTLAFVRLIPGTDIAVAKRDITSRLETVAPSATVQDRDEYAGKIRAQITQMLNLITALVLLAIIIALLGVLITMLLAVFERTHELGLLRAVGMDRRDVRSMVRWEAAIISTFGAVLGVVLGVGLGYALTRALRDQGVSAIEVPYRSLVIMILLITVAGVGASLYPARRAARLNVLTAIATQ